jgi:hypothetical protein
MKTGTNLHHRKLAGALACLSLLALPGMAGADNPDVTLDAGTLAAAAQDLLSPQEQQSGSPGDAIVLPGDLPGGLDDEFVPIPFPGASAPTSGEFFDAPACTYRRETTSRDVAYVLDDRFPPRVVLRTTTTTETEARQSLAIGINDHGTFGLRKDGVTAGFQAPAGGLANENLAVGWWGEGYLINVRNSAGGPGSLTSYYPHGPNAGSVQRIDDFYLDSDRYVTYRVTVAVPAGEGGGHVLVDFEFTLDKEDCDVTLRTRMLNQSGHFVDIDYDRTVDWDNLDHANSGSGSFFRSDWRIDGSSIVATRELSAVSYATPTAIVEVRTSFECRTTATGVTMPYAYDINAWDDRTTVGPGASHRTTPASDYDGNAGFSYERDGLAPGAGWDTFLVYSCSALTENVTTSTGGAGGVGTLDDVVGLLDANSTLPK